MHACSPRDETRAFIFHVHCGINNPQVAIADDVTYLILVLLLQFDSRQGDALTVSTDYPRLLPVSDKYDQNKTIVAQELCYEARQPSSPWSMKVKSRS